MLDLKDFVSRFVDAYRGPAELLLTEQAKAYLSKHKYGRELILAKPCQVEAFEFNDPYRSYRLILVFLFDKTKPDLTVSINSVDSTSIAIDLLKAKYPELQLDSDRTAQMLERFVKVGLDVGFSWDVYENVLGICFPYDPRLGDNQISRSLMADAHTLEKLARTIFYTISGQADE